MSGSTMRTINTLTLVLISYRGVLASRLCEKYPSSLVDLSWCDTGVLCPPLLPFMRWHKWFRLVLKRAPNFVLIASFCRENLEAIQHSLISFSEFLTSTLVCVECEVRVPPKLLPCEQSISQVWFLRGCHHACHTRHWERGVQHGGNRVCICSPYLGRALQIMKFIRPRLWLQKLASSFVWSLDWDIGRTTVAQNQGTCI